jgi:hypothetical protein
LLTLCAACEQAGATTIISGCTELPLVLWPERVAAATQSEREINLLNPAEVLADEVVFRTLRTRSLDKRLPPVGPGARVSLQGAELLADRGTMGQSDLELADPVLEP